MPGLATSQLPGREGPALVAGTPQIPAGLRIQVGIPRPPRWIPAGERIPSASSRVATRAPRGRAPAGWEELGAAGSPRGMSFPGWRGRVLLPPHFGGSQSPFPSMWLPLHAVSWPQGRCRAREPGAFLPQGLLATPSPLEGSPGPQRGQQRGRVGSGVPWGLRFEMAAPSSPGSRRAKSGPVALQDIPTQNKSPEKSLSGPWARAGLGGIFHAGTGVVGAVSKCPRGVVAPEESFPGVLPLCCFFCWRWPLPGAVLSVWNKC